MLAPQRGELLEKSRYAMICRFPIHPGKFVVLTIRVVVAELSPADLVAPEQHRNTLRQHERRQQISALPMPEGIYRVVRRYSLGATIPGTIVVLSIPVRLAIGCIVFFIVGNEVCESEPIVARNEVNTG